MSSKKVETGETWAVFDLGHRYVPKAWATYEEAERIRQDLLRHYPANSVWRTRLTVGLWKGPKEITREP